MTVCTSMYLYNSLILSSVGVPALISLSITVCLSVCLSVSWSVCLMIVIPSLSLYCYLYVFISVSLSLCLPVLQFFSFSVLVYLFISLCDCLRLSSLHVIFLASTPLGSAQGSSHDCNYSSSRDHSRPILV